MTDNNIKTMVVDIRESSDMEIEELAKETQLCPPGPSSGVAMEERMMKVSFQQ